MLLAEVDYQGIAFLFGAIIIFAFGFVCGIFFILDSQQKSETTKSITKDGDRYKSDKD